MTIQFNTQFDNKLERPVNSQHNNSQHNNSQHNDPQASNTQPKRFNSRGQLVGALAFITIGTILLLARFVEMGDLGALVPIGIGVLLLAWGAAAQSIGPIIPGGIIAGIGLGAQLETQVLADEGGLFFLGFAAGWVAITVVSSLFTDETVYWALIPGSILALIGSALLVGGAALTALSWLGALWPLVFVGVGLYMLYHWFKRI